MSDLPPVCVEDAVDLPPVSVEDAVDLPPVCVQDAVDLPPVSVEDAVAEAEQLCHDVEAGVKTPVEEDEPDQVVRDLRTRSRTGSRTPVVLTSGSRTRSRLSVNIELVSYSLQSIELV